MQRITKKKINKGLILNLITIFFLLGLPYYLFAGKLYIGGDDTRLLYVYPWDYLRNVSFYSWVNISSVGSSLANQFLLPFLGFWTVLSNIIVNKIVLGYLAFSIPLVLGFIYFQKTVKELFNLDEKTDLEVFLGSLFYILSPILIVNQLFIFLTTMWLIGLIPITCYYFIRYLKTSDFRYVFIEAIWGLIFSLALFSIPWILGFSIPVLVGLGVLSFFYSKKDKLFFIKRSIIFFGFILISQSFWIAGFLFSFMNIDKNSFAAKLVTSSFLDTFTPTVISTATSTIIYPLLSIFHRQIILDFSWSFRNVFIDFYDKIFFLNSAYILIIAFGVLNYKKYLNKSNRIFFIVLLVSFITSLYLFTVNIGPLKDLFLVLGHMPGFVMFRNFYDKFALGYVFIFSILISISFIIIKNKFSTGINYILILFFFIIILNFSTINSVVNSPLWKTNNIHRNIVIPEEYLNFMRNIKQGIRPTNNILSVPFGNADYSVIKDENSNNVYVGVSPVKIFTGVNDISGHSSFNFTKEADIVNGLIANRNYSEFNKILFEHNINYVLVTKNIPQEVKDSYIFSKDVLVAQDINFINAITNKKLLVSSSGNYKLYKAKKINSLINSKNVYFQKINNVEYKIYIKNLDKSQILSFIDSYHADWKLFIQKNPNLNFCVNPIKNQDTGSTECEAGNRLFSLNDLKYSFEKPIFDTSHGLLYDYASKWIISPNVIKESYDKNYYKTNKDGSIDMELVLYFTPQNYFYLGILISVLVFTSGAFYLFLNRRNEKSK